MGRTNSCTFRRQKRSLPWWPRFFRTTPAARRNRYSAGSVTARSPSAWPGLTRPSICHHPVPRGWPGDSPGQERAGARRSGKRMPMDLQFIYVIALAVLALLGGLLAARLLRQSRTAEDAAKESAEHSRVVQTDMTTLRLAKLDVERRLALEEQKSARIPELEKALTAAAGRIDQSRQAKAAVDSELAVARESVARLEAAGADAASRQAAAERARDDLAAQAEVMREHMNEMERTIAGRSEAAQQQEQAAGELRQRLSAAEAARDQALARIDSAVQAKAEAEATLARAASQIQEKTQRIESLQEE